MWIVFSYKLESYLQRLLIALFRPAAFTLVLVGYREVVVSNRNL
jgi:hypothetical protein